MIGRIKNRYLRGVAAWCALLFGIVIIGPLIIATASMHAVISACDWIKAQWGDWSDVRRLLVPLLKFEEKP